MDKKINHEGIKTIAMIAMLIDHIGVSLYPSDVLRMIGRVAFPIYCFLLTEGFCHTGDRWRYAGRLLLMAVIAEMPYDLFLYGRWNCNGQSVMLTLLCGVAMMAAMQEFSSRWQKAVIIAGVALVNESLSGEYGAAGILMIAMFCVTRGMKEKIRFWMQALAMILLCLMIPSTNIILGTERIPIQIFGVAAMLPIIAYSEKKRSSSEVWKWFAYWFYPLHLLALYIIKIII